MKKEELNKILELHAAYLKDNKEGQRANLSGVNLRYANLNGVDLRYANLRNTNLRYANLSDANLRGVDLRGAELRGIDLSGAKDGDKPLEICKTVLGLEWDILIFNQDVTVGCKKFTYQEWKAFSEEEIAEMDSHALKFYPMLMGILDYEYGKRGEM